MSDQQPGQDPQPLQPRPYRAQSSRPPEPYAPLAPEDRAEPDPLADPDALDAAMAVEADAEGLAKVSNGGLESVVGHWRSPLGRLVLLPCRPEQRARTRGQDATLGK